MMSQVVEIENQAKSLQLTPAMRSMLDRSKSALQQMIPERIIACSIYGSHLRGYPGAISDNDVLFLLRRHNLHYFEHTPIDPCLAKDRTDTLSRSLSSDLGFRISVSFIDEQRMLTGMMRNNPHSMAMYQTLECDSKYVREHYKPIYEKYFNNSAMISGLLKTAIGQLSRARTSEKQYAYRIERNYLTSLWGALRALHYITEAGTGGQHRANMTLSELITATGGMWAEKIGVLTDTALFEPYYNRTNSMPGDAPKEVTDESLFLLDSLISHITKASVVYLQREPVMLPTREEQSEVLLNFYNRNNAYFSE